MFRVVRQFFDLTDGNREYAPGDTFPRDGVTVSAARLAELATSNNRLGYSVIEEIKDVAEKAEKPAPRKRVKKSAD